MSAHSVFQTVSNTSAVAENSAVAELPAVAGVSSERLIVVTKEEIRRAGTQPWKLNNTALKSIRDSNELPVGVPIVWGIDLFESDEYEIWTDRLIAPKTPLTWRKVLNAMSDETLDRIVGEGMLGITCQPIPNTCGLGESTMLNNDADIEHLKCQRRCEYARM